MNRDDARTKLKAVFREVFDDEALEITDSSIRDNLPAWDSLGHIRLVSATEEAFGMTFSIEEIEAMTSVGRILDTVLAKA